MTTICLV